MRQMLIHVAGIPAPQGSKMARPIKRAGQYTGQVVVIESSKEKVQAWREAVRGEAQKLVARSPVDGPYFDREMPLQVTIVFRLPRPKSAPKKVTHPVNRPDLDKLIRSTLDGLTQAGVYGDDSQVVAVLASKQFGRPGAIITIEEATSECVECDE